jgi:hypothetical protein
MLSPQLAQLSLVAEAASSDGSNDSEKLVWVSDSPKER